MPFLFITTNYSPEVINIQWRKAELNIILPKVNNFDIKQKRYGIFLLLYGTDIIDITIQTIYPSTLTNVHFVEEDWVF